MTQMTNSTQRPYFHRAGWPFIALFLLVAMVLCFVGGVAAFVGIVLAGWCFYFFRDPARVTPTRPGLIISPADGKVVLIQDVVPDPEFELGDEPRTRISIFLNVFDVHVNRSPAEGTVVARRYRPGKFVNAALDKASVDNERMGLTLKLTGDHPKAGETLGVVQIAGLVARRIVCDAQEGQSLQTGAHYGIIRFGSRTDVYLPRGVAPLVAVGQYMIGGETVLADCAGTEPARAGVVRA
ncbi:MAG: phosphatidylserine decarboxylase [Alphaproteobacteria bacterium]|nr:phosphatidylserine decarboxylase [Alphaproteobacteria bacterium]